MKQSSLGDKARLMDILASIADVEYTVAKPARDRTSVMAIAYGILIVGEACRMISPELKGSHPSIPWADIIGMRNRLVHEYSKIDERYLWEVVESHLPLLKSQVEDILRNAFET